MGRGRSDAVSSLRRRHAAARSRATAVVGCERSIRRLARASDPRGARGGTPKMTTLRSALRARPGCARPVRGLALPGPRATRGSRRRMPVRTRRRSKRSWPPRAVPFLHACNRQWARRSLPSLDGGILSRVRLLAGICRNARHRAHPLLPVRPVRRRVARPPAVLPYCALDDHDELVYTRAGEERSNAVHRRCKRCHGYVKTFTRLQGCPPDSRDARRSGQGCISMSRRSNRGTHARPGAGHPLDVTVMTRHPRGFFAWNT